MKATSRSALMALLLLVASIAAGPVACNSQTAQKEAGTTAAAQHAHATAGETCVICDPSKRDKGRLWCKEHARYEDRCWLCHPELRDPDRPYCDEHFMYEDECVLCDPSRAADAHAAAPEAAEAPELFCNEHGVPEMQCGTCQPQLAAELAAGESLLVRLASARSADLAGLEIGRPSSAAATTSLSLLGEIRLDGNRLARVTPLSGGVLTEVRVDVGQEVSAGETLAVVNAAGVAAAKAEYLSAKADLRMWQSTAKRQRDLVEQRLGTQRDLDVARASSRRAQVAVKLAAERLQNFGFSAEAVAGTKTASSELAIRAPFSGTVIERSAVLGEAVDNTAALFSIADLGEMWIVLSVPAERAGQLQLGTPLEVRVRALPGVTLDGQVTWIDPVIDERTRMVRVRGTLPNGTGALRHGMFANVEAIVGIHPDAVLLPSDAVHRVDGRPFVFVQQEPDLFAARRVEVGDRQPSDQIAVRQGITPDDRVVVRGGFAIKSALLASRLGAGCTDD